jgi:hypothetical protein
MAGAPKGNQNARKHGLYAKKAKVEIITPGDGEAAIEVRDPRRAIKYLEGVMDEIVRRMAWARDDDFTRLANSLSLATTALLNAHRTVAYLTGEMTPVEDALRELEALGFDED